MQAKDKHTQLCITETFWSERLKTIHTGFIKVTLESLSGFCDEQLYIPFYLTHWLGKRKLWAVISGTADVLLVAGYGG